MRNEANAIESAGQRDDGQQWYVSELFRIKGEALLQEGSDQSTSAAEDCFDQSARWPAIRAPWPGSCAPPSAWLVCMTQGRHANARQVLAPVYDRFTEGFATLDLRAARDLLDTLRS